MSTGTHLSPNATAWPEAAAGPIHIRRWRRLLRPAVVVSLLLHVAAIGAMLWFGIRSGSEPAGPEFACQIRLDRDLEVAEDAPEEFEPPLEEVHPDDIVPPPDPVFEVEQVFEEEDVEFELEEATVPQAPPVEIAEVPLRVAVRRPRPTPPPPAPTVSVPPPTVRRPSPPPPPTPRPTPRGARVPRRRAPLRVIYRPDPRRYYPTEARAQRLAGTTQVVLLIDASGRVSDVTVERSSGSAILDRAAMIFARAYRFNADAGWRRIRLPVGFR